MEALQSSYEIIRRYAKFLFDKDYSLYTAKQWGISPSEIDPSILKRVPLRLFYEDGYFDDKYQVVPKRSYEDFFKNILCHVNIKVQLGIEALKHFVIDEQKNRILVDGNDNITVIYTGAIDELFGCRYGKLPYRSLKFDWKYEDKYSFQSAPLVAYPQADGYTRIVEYKKLPLQDVCGTSYAVEYPLQYSKEAEIEPYYPLLTDDSQQLYQKYNQLSSYYTNLLHCGRLADFKYYNMDQCLERALNMIRIIINKNNE